MRAFTLIEIIITVALAAILMVAIGQLYIVYGRSVSVQTASLAVNLGVKNVVDATREFGLQADHVISTHTFNSAVYTSSATTSIFELPSIDASGNVIANSYDYATVFASSTEAYQIIDAAAGSARTSGTKRLTDVLNGLTFTYDNASFPSVASLTVDATTSEVVHESTTQMHIQEQVYLRNL